MQTISTNISCQHFTSKHLLVLTNAYKNTNDYNMITPRAPTAYDTFDKLISNGFKIFTRLASTKGYTALTNLQSHLGNKTTNITIDQHNVQMQIDEYHTTAIVAISEILVNLISSGMIGNYSEKEKSSINMLVNHSSLLPGVLGSLSGQQKIAKLNPSVHNLGTSSDYQYLENITIRQVLEDCRNNAVVLPYAESHEQAKMLSKMHLSGRSYLGKESWLATDIGIYLKGLVTPAILETIGELKQCSIWQWLQNGIPNGVNLYIENRKGLLIMRAPTMDGNIIIIFTVWLIGLGIALVKLICEIGKNT